MKYIYTISDPDTGDVIYVGSTSNIEQRARTHVNGSSACVTYLKTLIDCGVKPLFTVVDKSENNWGELERLWINRMIEQGCTLYNKISVPKAVNIKFDIIDLTK